MRPQWSRAMAAAAVVITLMVGSLPARADVAVLVNPSNRPTALSGDFNGDGRADIALVGASGWNGLSVALRNASGFTVSYASAPAFAAWASLPGVRVIVGDFNADQADDIALTGVAGWTRLPVAMSNGDGTFNVVHGTAGAFPGWAALPDVQVVAGDVNNDGRTDLALTGGDGWTTIPVALSAGNGTFTVANAPAPAFAALGATDDVRVLGGDFDADGRGDLVLVPGGDTLLTDLALTVAVSNGDGSFRETRTWLPEFVGSTDRRAVTRGDYNNDGQTDLAVVTEDTIMVAYSRARGTFELFRAEASPEFATLAAEPDVTIVAGNFDCDNRTDLALLPEADNTWTTMPFGIPRGVEEFLFMNEPLPNFPRRAGDAGAQVVVGDYDLDGCDDMALVGGTGWNTIRVAISNGDGSLAEQDVMSPTFAGWAGGTSPVTLPPAPQETVGSLSILDSLAWSGIESSVAVGVDGLPIISYYVSNPPLDNLRVAHCLDVACTAITTTDIDTVGQVGKFSSIEIGSDGLPLISYVALRDASDKFSEDLKVAHCNDVACTSATVTTLDAPARVNDLTSLAIGGDGLGLISYQDQPSVLGNTVNRIKVAHCHNVACTSATLSTVDTVGSDGGADGSYDQTGIATGNHGLGLLAYYDGTHEALKVAACTNADCSSRVITILDKVTPPGILHGGYASVTFGLDGLALISYRGNTNSSIDRAELKVAHCLNVYCTAATTIVADTGAGIGFTTAIAIGGDGLGVVSYWDARNWDLKVAHCANLACSAATATTVDAFGFVAFRSSITAGTDGLPLISYWENVEPGVGTTLRVVRCGNSDCTAPIVAPF